MKVSKLEFQIFLRLQWSSEGLKCCVSYKCVYLEPNNIKKVWFNKSEFTIKVYDWENYIAKENNNTVIHKLIISIEEVKNQTANSQL